MTCARPRAQLASILLLTAVIACGCASSASTSSQPTANRSTLPIELVLYARDAQRHESYYEVRRDGTLAWGGGRDALMRSTSWSGPLLKEETEQLLALLEQQGWFEARPKSTRQPKGQYYSLELTHDGDLRTRHCTGRWEAIEPIERLLHDASLRRLQPEIDALPRAALIERKRQAELVENAPDSSDPAPEPSVSRP